MRRLTFFLVVACAVLCAGCGSNENAPVGPCGAPPEFAYSEDMARNLDERLLPYLQGTTGEFTLQTTSQELTSWLTYSTLRWPGIPLRDAVVWFSPERIHFSGVVSRVMPFSFSVQLHARVWLDSGVPQLVLEDACLGRFALPTWLKRLGQRIANETIMDSGPYVRLEELQVGDGEVYARGRIGR